MNMTSESQVSIWSSATEVLPLLKSGKLSIEKYVVTLCERIKSRESTVKGWAYLDYDRIVSEAKRLDAIPISQRGPLFGLPIGIKDVVFTTGMPCI